MKKLLTFISGTMLFVGFPFIGWGITHWHDFFENPARLTYILLMIVLSAVLMIWVPENITEGKGMKLQKKHRFSLLFLQITPLLIWWVIDEEISLHKQFNEKWDSYKKKSYALNPFII